MSIADQEKIFLSSAPEYSLCRWDEWDYSCLRDIPTVNKKSHGHWMYNNEAVIMADTETSKDVDHAKEVYENHVVAFTVSIRAAGRNIVTLYGSDPDDNIKCIEKIHSSMPGERTYIYYHNLSYDWVFLRQFYFARFGFPERQLNTKSHYPISIEFDNGVILRDSLILAQRSLEKWGNDLAVEHRKAVAEWDYDKVRHQGGVFTDSELKYIEHDTLCGVECLDAMRHTLSKKVCTMPYTATGIVREQFRKTARTNRGREWFLRQVLDYQYVSLSENVYHGGFTHMNRFLKNITIDSAYTGGEPVVCMDLASSYPFALCSEKYPCEKFHAVSGMTPEKIVSLSSDHAFMFRVEFYGIRLKDDRTEMPVLQKSKALNLINDLTDNGRIISADLCTIELNEIDMCLIAEQYTWDQELTEITQCITAEKDYLPRWFTDFVYGLFKDKTQLKGGDPVLYALAKAKLNSCYGMCCQHVMQNDIIEDYETGEYETEITQTPEVYEKYVKKMNTFLPYQIGIWCTSYAMKNLFELGSCVDYENGGEWIYSDTDSCFAYKWDETKLRKYNQDRIDLMHSRGYDGIEHNERTYYLGIAEKDKVCEEFRGIHSKCYCYRDAEKHELHITVAGVPKRGVTALDNDINNFRAGLVFPGSQTHKLTHTYFFNKIHTDSHGDKIGDSIDLSACDYLVNDDFTISWKDAITDEIEVQTYEEQ